MGNKINPMTHRRSSFTILSCLLLVLLLLLMGSLILGALYLPGRAEVIFGPIALQFDLFQRIRLSGKLLWQEKELTTPVNPLGAPQPFVVELGEAPPQIARRLFNDGFIHNPGSFLSYLQYSGLDTTLQAGNYTLSSAMTTIEIARTLQDATPDQVSFSVLDGWRIEEITASLPTSGLRFSPELFVQASHSIPAGYDFLNELPDTATLEGFLAPGTYQLSRTLRASELITVLLDNFLAQLTPEIIQGFNQQNLTIFQAVILASIIEREAIIEDEMPLIASVLFNRLSAGMRLEADSTVQYAIGYNKAQEKWWTNPLSVNDLHINSPYNTYQNSGLPPGPIANPGITALRAVAFPAQSPYYYFRAACDGSGKHAFARTYAEHLQNACP